MTLRKEKLIWTTRPQDPEFVSRLASSAGVPFVVAQTLVGRNIVDPEEVANRRDTRLGHGYCASERGKEDQHEEREPQPGPRRPERREDLRQSHEHEAGARVYRRAPRPRLRGEQHHDGYYHESREHRHKRIRNGNPHRRARHGVAPPHVASVRDHYAHRKRKRVEHLPHGAQHDLADVVA